jgi:hypothetical protein
VPGPDDRWCGAFRGSEGLHLKSVVRALMTTLQSFVLPALLSIANKNLLSFFKTKIRKEKGTKKIWKDVKKDNGN